jgi:hypothetical protein
MTRREKQVQFSISEYQETLLWIKEDVSGGYGQERNIRNQVFWPKNPKRPQQRKTLYYGQTLAWGSGDWDSRPSQTLIRSMIESQASHFASLGLLQLSVEARWARWLQNYACKLLLHPPSAGRGCRSLSKASSLHTVTYKTYGLPFPGQV